MAPSSVQLEDVFRLVGTRLADRITIESVVARGGFGLVYRGRHEALGVPVAVKVLLSFAQYSERMRAEFSRRFMQESRLIARLSHPATVRLVDHGVDLLPDGEFSPWMALEWLDGRPLHHVARERGEGARYPLAEALGLLRPSLEALAEAHGLGIAHRDITPANIFVCEGASGPRSRLIDFGVAREMEDDAAPGMGFTATRSSVHAFTMKYAAPEQVSHARTGPWTDVHAMGLVLTQLVTGEAPYPGRDETERTAQVLSARRPTPAAFGVDVGPLEPVLARAVALRPADRYAHAGALLEAIDAAIEGVSEAAPRTPQLPPPGLAMTAPQGPLRAAEDGAFTSVPSGLMTATTVLPPAETPARGARVLATVISVAAVCVALLFASLALPRSAPLVASAPETAPVPHALAPVAPLPAVALPIVAQVPVAPTERDAATPPPHRPTERLARRPGPPRERRPAPSPPAAPQEATGELPRCRSLHERNCRP